MTPDPKCPECGAELPADAPRGHCPACLLRAGLGGDTSEALETGPGARLLGRDHVAHRHRPDGDHTDRRRAVRSGGFTPCYTFRIFVHAASRWYCSANEILCCSPKEVSTGPRPSPRCEVRRAAGLSAQVLHLDAEGREPLPGSLPSATPPQARGNPSGRAGEIRRVDSGKLSKYGAAQRFRFRVTNAASDPAKIRRRVPRRGSASSRARAMTAIIRSRMVMWDMGVLGLEANPVACPDRDGPDNLDDRAQVEQPHEPEGKGAHHKCQQELNRQRPPSASLPGRSTARPSPRTKPRSWGTGATPRPGRPRGRSPPEPGSPVRNSRTLKPRG